MSWGWLRIAPLHREETVSDDVTFAKGLRCNGKTGVNTTLNAVLELYAGKLSRTVPRGPRFREGTWLPSLQRACTKQPARVAVFGTSLTVAEISKNKNSSISPHQRSISGHSPSSPNRRQKREPHGRYHLVHRAVLMQCDGSIVAALLRPSRPIAVQLRDYCG
jgi:hypothetical protein